ncbi:hypothetical protein MIND_00937200 [Mycena indigotica]|uniref:Uncharacterized protein n=1 Tax=Mycena indigotica TaxID=2126181 RepID=A0A8H6VZ03_9AGAR|nr:uncharacterized protein MIND_00937200 [Mycena indigotica]KAF7297046.1 hypothetical protein MIND_00937200 [Mycena indigotica]
MSYGASLPILHKHNCEVVQRHLTRTNATVVQYEKGSWTGLLFAAGAWQTRLVQMSLYLGTSAPYSVYDIDVVHWISAGCRPNASSVNWDNNFYQFDRWPPQNDIQLPRVFTVFSATQPPYDWHPEDVIEPENRFVSRGIAEDNRKWWGNILVVCLEHTTGGIGNITLEDEQMCKALVKHVVNNRLKGREPYAW